MDLTGATALVEKAGFGLQPSGQGLLRIVTKKGVAVGSVAIPAGATPEQIIAATKEALTAAAKEPGARAR